ncbi:MAG: diphosphomevalonate decarboxylase [Alyxoria varia]|nr:MAG: diphosphomevalonate decarboxylase [Alyxoria varia]
MAAVGNQDRRVPIYRHSVTAPVNIAVIKYWGKRDAVLNLPTNDSLSVTLSQRDLRTHTTASCCALYQTDTLLLNGQPQDISNQRTQNCLRELRRAREKLESGDHSLPPLSEYHLRIVSANNFPTAAGLASSAAGFAALVRAVADLYSLPHSPEELSRIARQGSGSACRSLFGGYAAWHMGQRVDGSDSLASSIAPSSHWPTLRALILVASDAKKDVSSTAGMQATVATSALFATRASDIVPHRMAQMQAAIKERDFSTFGLLAMRDSNNFHATCADTWPPVFYMNDTSRAAVRMVEVVNEAAGEMVCAYTFDAGPNAVVFFEKDNEEWVHSCFKAVVGHVEGWNAKESASPAGQAMSMSAPVKVDEKIKDMLQSGVSRVIITGVGDGPVSVIEHLVDENGEARTARS